jgi:uncharacterized phage protein (TIGR02220 family)
MGFFHLKQKMSERKAVKFYRSYWEVAMQLNDKDRLAFYDALMLRQFTGEETSLKGMANFAYISQKHSIDAQVKGFEDKTKTPLVHPTQGGMQPPMVQVQEKEKEKEQYTIDFQALLDFVNQSFGRKLKVVTSSVKSSFKARLKEGYKKEDILNAIKNCKENKYHKENNYQYCTLEFFSRSSTLDKYADRTIVTESDSILAVLNRKS